MTAVVTDYQSLMVALRARIEELAISYELFDELAGWAKGTAGKVFGPSEVKRLGVDNMWIALGTLALQFEVQNDPAAVARMERRWEHRSDIDRRVGNTARELSPSRLARVAKEMGRKGGLTPKRFRISKEKRSQINRRNIKMRWRRKAAHASNTCRSASPPA